MALVDNTGTPGMPDVLLNSGYDTLGNRASLSATLGGVKDFFTSYSYDALSRLDEIDQQGQSGGNAVAMKSIYFALDPIGDVTQIDRSNSVFAGPQQNSPAYSVLSYAAATGLLTGRQTKGANRQTKGTQLVSENELRPGCVPFVRPLCSAKQAGAHPEATHKLNWLEEAAS